ncbi:hypothetical protein EDF70_1011343 [Neorhizobium sp. JUb45]|nr:hypothetical protein EDF70_1011343 [Neorhizobium sp. JUb45]
MNSLQQWYNYTNPKQRILMYTVSGFLVLAWGIGLVPLVFLLYFHFGSEKEAVVHYDDNNPPPKGSPEYYDWANREGRWADRK